MVKKGAAVTINRMLVQYLLGLAFLAALAPAIKAQSSPTSTTTPKLRIGYVKDGDIGCGCSLSLNAADLRKRRHVYVGGMDEPAYVNLDGKNLELRLIDFSDTNDIPEVGDRSWETYVAGAVKVRIDWTVTRVCNSEDESCEVTYYKAIITVTRKTQRTIVKTVGLCGC